MSILTPHKQTVNNLESHTWTSGGVVTAASFQPRRACCRRPWVIDSSSGAFIRNENKKKI